MFLVSFITAILLALTTVVNTSGSVSESNPVVREFPVCFRWDNPHYDPSYLDNAKVEKDLLAFIDSLGTPKIERIDIIAFASPEGSVSRNKELSKLRSAELKWLILKNYPETRGRFVLRPSGESWTMLRERVAADKKLSDASRNKILRTLDDKSLSLDARKWRLSKGLGNDPNVGDVWQYLLRAHYRYLRGGAVIVIYKVPDSAPDGLAPDAAPAAPDTAPDAAAPDAAAPDAASAAPVIPSEAKESTEAKAPADTVAPKPLIDSTLSQTLPPKTVKEESGQTADNKPFKRHERKPLLGVSTNLIYDATYIPHYSFTSVPSFSLEYYPDRGHWTFGADVDWSHWLHYEDHRFNQIHNVTLNARRYFKSGEELFKGLYLLGNVNIVQYGLGWDAHGWEGEGLGLSAGIGNKWHFARIYIDVGACVGALYSRFDPYTWGNDATRWYYYDYAGKPEDFTERSKSFLWFGPTRIWFSIGYDLFMRRKK